MVAATGSDYDTWGAPYGLAPGSEGGDLDNDGLTNFSEYAFGLIPNSGSSVNPISPQLNKSSGLFKYTRRNTAFFTTGVTYSYEYSTTLSGAWTHSPRNPPPPTTATPPRNSPSACQAACSPTRNSSSTSRPASNCNTNSLCLPRETDQRRGS